VNIFELPKIYVLNHQEKQQVLHLKQRKFSLFDISLSIKSSLIIYLSSIFIYLYARRTLGFLSKLFEAKSYDDQAKAISLIVGQLKPMVASKSSFLTSELKSNLALGFFYTITNQVRLASLLISLSSTKTA